MGYWDDETKKVTGNGNLVGQAKDAARDPGAESRKIVNSQQAINPLAYGTKQGTVAGDFARGDPYGVSQDSKSHSAERKAADEAAAEAQRQTAYGRGQGYNAEMDAQGQKYLDQMDQSHTDASKTYTNTIQPNLKNLMERANADTSHAMTLQQAMDPNNAVATQTRQLYETQAQNEGRQGLADTGVLQAMGMQSMGSQLNGAGPMTGGQLAALMGQNQAQSGAAYAQTQRRMQGLRDQGLNMGFQRSDQAYNQGLDAQQRLGNTTAQYGNAYNQQRASDESNYGLHNAMSNQKTLRNQALDAWKYGGDTAAINAQIAGENAKQAQQAQMATGALSTAGTVAGAYFGGPAGAAAGGKAGQAVGNAADESPSANDGTVSNLGYTAPDTGKTNPDNFVEAGGVNRQGTRSLGASGRYSPRMPSAQDFSPQAGARRRA